MKKSKRIEKLEDKIARLESANLRLEKEHREMTSDILDLIDGNHTYQITFKYRLLKAIRDNMAELIWAGER